MDTVRDFKAIALMKRPGGVDMETLMRELCISCR